MNKYPSESETLYSAYLAAIKNEYEMAFRNYNGLGEGRGLSSRARLVTVMDKFKIGVENARLILDETLHHFSEINVDRTGKS